MTGCASASLLPLAGLALFGAATAAEAQTAQMAQSESTAMGKMQGGSAPPDARDPNAYAEGVDFTRGEGRPRLADRESFGSLLFDNLEVARTDGETQVPYDLEGWFGRTFDRAVLKAEGELESGNLADARTELLWGHAVAPYWDTQVGVRYDSGEGPNRTWLAAGIEGLAPYRFDLELTAYVGESSRTALRLDASYEMLLTQRLILQPRFETNLYGKSDPERGLGSGLADITLSLRLRYEIRREIAPYIGFEWVDRYGGTEDLMRAAGRDASDSRVVLGTRFWF